VPPSPGGLVIDEEHILGRAARARASWLPAGSSLRVLIEARPSTAVSAHHPDVARGPGPMPQNVDLQRRTLCRLICDAEAGGPEP
jgi:hypothetical protein